MNRFAQPSWANPTYLGIPWLGEFLFWKEGQQRSLVPATENASIKAHSHVIN
jgi:hypothetical protein